MARSCIRGAAAACVLLLASSVLVVSASKVSLFGHRQLTSTGCGAQGCGSGDGSWGSGGAWSGGGSSGGSGGSSGSSGGSSGGGSASDYGIICNGKLQYISIPEYVGDGGGNSGDGNWQYPAGLTCGRRSNANGETGCGAQPRVQCQPFSSNIGPINQAYGDNAGPVPKNELALPPDNPLIFTIDQEALPKSFFVWLNWTVFDVGSGGAKFVANYGSGQSVTLTHQWTNNGPSPPGGNSNCGACTNCEVGKGIKNFFVESEDSSDGFTSFELSQLYKDIRCGLSCFDLDASYWVGMEYVCAGPTCGDTDPTQPNAQKFRCQPADAFEFNPRASSNTTLSTSSCCLKRTCANINPATSPGQQFDCSQGNTAQQTCTMKNPMDTTSVPGVSTCCTCSPIIPPGVKVTKTAAAAKKNKKKTTKKKKNTKGAAVDDGDEEVIAASGSVTVGAGSGCTFTITTEPESSGGSGGSSEPITNVQMIDVLPPGLELTGVSGDGGACTTSGSTITCNWGTIGAGSSKTITVAAKTTQAGSLQNCATVTASGTDQNPSNNRDCATVQSNPSCFDSDAFQPGAQPFPCASFNIKPTPGREGQNCTMKMPMDTTSTPSVIACCECVPIAQSTVDLSIEKTVSAKKKAKKKTKKTKKKGTSSASAEDDDVEAAAAPAGNMGSTTVGGTATWNIRVTNNGLLGGSSSVAENVIITDVVPAGLTVLSANTDGSCKTSGRTYTCTFASISVGQSKTITVTTRADQPGEYINCASITGSTPPDSNTADNEDCATLQVKAACCKTIGTTSTCTDVLPGGCGSGDFVVDQACMDGPCIPPPTPGACCIFRSTGNTCFDNTDADTCARQGGVFTQSTTCANLEMSGTCPIKVNDQGACCLTDVGKCVDKQTQDMCLAAGGRFWLDATCLDLVQIGLCKPDDGKTGSCCNLRDGSCRNNVKESQCDPATSNWVEGGTCGEMGFCVGSCCNKNAPNTCSETTKASCSYTWKLYGSCEEDCRGPIPPNCNSEWEPCNPNDPSSCCDGLSCQYTWAGCKVGSYVCKSRPNNQCVTQGAPCGGPTGNTCCKGFTCSWDYTNDVGTCQPSGGCVPHGGSCKSHYDTCRGCLCYGGMSKWVTHGMCYKPCGHYGCYLQRQMNCQAYYASAASL